MKLLLYSHYFTPSVGGVETVVLSLARGLAELRDTNGQPEFEITLATQTRAEKFDDAALPFCVIRQPSLPRLWQIVRAADVVHAAGPALQPLFLGWLARKPLVLEHHGYQAVCPNGLLLHQPDCSVCPGHFLAGHYAECLRCCAQESGRTGSWKNLILMFPRHFFARRAAANLAISQHSLERQALPRSRVIYHGIEDPLANEHVSDPAASVPKKICFGCVGRLVQEKGAPVLLEAAGILRDEGHVFEIRFIGDGPERPKLEAMIARNSLGSFIRILGFLTGTSLAEALRGVHVVVMPSIWEETAGLSAMEQMMRGRLVIGSDIGGLGEIVSDAGLKFPPGNATMLAQAMRKVLEQPSMIASLGQKSRERARRFFEARRMIEDHARVYRGLAGAQK